MRSGLAILGLALALAACQEKASEPEASAIAPTARPTVPASPAPQPPAPKPAASAAPAPREPVRFQALGTEPFWSITVLPGGLRYASPDAPDGIAFAATHAVAGATHRFTGTLQARPVVLTIAPGTCSDGMSDMVYAFTASFTWGTRTERGCARVN